jgi:hypothetical protein
VYCWWRSTFLLPLRHGSILPTHLTNARERWAALNRSLGSHHNLLADFEQNGYVNCYHSTNVYWNRFIRCHQPMVSALHHFPDSLPNRKLTKEISRTAFPVGGHISIVTAISLYPFWKVFLQNGEVSLWRHWGGSVGQNETCCGSGKTVDCTNTFNLDRSFMFY